MGVMTAKSMREGGEICQRHSPLPAPSSCMCTRQCCGLPAFLEGAMESELGVEKPSASKALTIFHRIIHVEY